MTFNVKQARQGVKKAHRRKEKEELAKQKKEEEKREGQRLTAKKDLPKKMEEVMEWIKEQANEERTDGVFSGWYHYGHNGDYYEKLADLAVKELISLGFTAKKKWTEHGEFRPADDCPLQSVWTYPIYINWAVKKRHS